MEFLIEKRRFDEFKNHELYALLSLRAEVFVVEQECSYNDLDGLDQNATHFFYREGERIRGALRVYEKEGTTWIGRVVVARELRRQKLGKVLIEAAHRWAEERKLTRPLVLNSQTRYSDFYASLGYQRIAGSENFEDGIAHIRMQLA